jgi:hypothetical protein
LLAIVNHIGSDPAMLEPAQVTSAEESMSKDTYSQPSEVVAEDGKVLVDGPDGVDVALTPDAALETANRLTDEAARAAGQEREKSIDHRPN